MLCKFCNKRTKVYDSRLKMGVVIRRRRCNNQDCEMYNISYATKEVAAEPRKKRKPPPTKKLKQRKIYSRHGWHDPWDHIDDLTDEELENLITGGRDEE